MVNFRIVYIDGTVYERGGVTKMKYPDGGGSIITVETDLEKHAIPVNRELWLYSDNGVARVDGKEIRLIETTKA